MIRQEIIERLENFNVPANFSPLQEMLDAIEFTEERPYEEIKIKTWLRYSIESLFYKPNPYMLVFTGEQGIGKSEFFRYLSPKKNWYFESSSVGKAQDSSRDFMFICISDNELSYYSKVKQMRSLCMNQEFVVLNEFTNEPVADKRLASYCGTINEWHHPIAKTDLIVNIKSIDFAKLNAIDRNLLWAELYQSYKIKTYEYLRS